MIWVQYIYIYMGVYIYTQHHLLLIFEYSSINSRKISVLCMMHTESQGKRKKENHFFLHMRKQRKERAYNEDQISPYPYFQGELLTIQKIVAAGRQLFLTKCSFSQDVVDGKEGSREMLQQIVPNDSTVQPAIFMNLLMP